MADSTNPLELSYDAFWNCLEVGTAFAGLFPNGTRKQVRYHFDGANAKAPDPDMENLGPADYPRCKVTVNKVEPTINHDTCNSTVAMHLSVEICTGQQMQSILLQCAWALFCGASNWSEQMREAVVWSGYKVVTSVVVRPCDIRDAEQNSRTNQFTKDRNRGTLQWISVGDVTVNIAVKTADIKTT